MAIKMIFDPSNNIQSPTMVLTYKSGKSIGAILPQNIHYIESLNSYNEFSFDVYKTLNGVECKHWSKIKDFKIIYCVEWDAYFEIYVDIDESNDTVKHIQGRALSEAEVSQIKVYDLEVNTELDISREDYRPTIIYSEDPDISLVHKLLEKTPNFRIGHVDKSIAKLQRTFSFNDKTIYDSFNAVSEEVNCLVEYVAKKGDNGRIDRIINIYDLMSNCDECGHREIDGDICPEYEGNKSGHPDGGRKINQGFGEDTTIFVSTKNLADNISYSSNSDSVKNCFKLTAGDDLMTATVRNCSPSRNGYMWHFTEDTKADMSDELRVILSEYQETYDRYNTKFDSGDVDYGDTWGVILDEYNEVCVKYQKTEGSDDYKDYRAPDNFENFQEMMNTYYNTIDLELYLTSAMMPSTNIQNITASEQIGKLDNTYSISLQSISNLSQYSAENAIETFLNTIIDSRFKIRLDKTSFDDSVKRWVGKITIELFTNNEEEADDNHNFATSGNITFTFNDNVEEFTKQKIEKALAKERQNTPDIIALYDIDGEYKELSDFKNKIAEYGLNPLIRLRDAGQACLNLMIEMGISDGGNKTSNWIKNWENMNQDKSLYNDLYLPYYEKVSALSSEISQRQQDINIVTGTYDSNGNLITDGMMTYLLKIIMSIQSKLDLEGYITSLGGDSAEYLLQELVSFRREDTYRNENFISDGLDNSQLFLKALEFVKEAEKDIKLAAVPIHTITSTLKNLLTMKEFKALVRYFKVGNWIRAEIDGIIFRLRLIKYEVDFNNTNNINVEFSDVQLAKDSTAGIKSILDQATTIASNYSNIQVMAKQNKKSGDYVWEWVNDGLALTKMKIVDDAKNQNIVWDENGFLCREYSPILDNYEDKQLKIINKGLFLTDDNWKTSKAGIGNFIFYNPQTGQYEEDYGVIANTIVGNLILSEEVGIYNENNTVQIDRNGFIITTKNSNNTVFKIQKETSEDTFDNLLFIDSEGNLHIKGDITATSLELGDNINLDGYVTSEDLNGYAKSEEINKALENYAKSSDLNNYLLTKTYEDTDHIVFGVSRETTSENGDVIYFAVSTEGLLEAKNAVIYGTIYASAGEFAGELKAATGTFKGELSAATGTFKGELSAATGSFVGSLSSGHTNGGYNFKADNNGVYIGRLSNGTYSIEVDMDGKIKFGSGVSLSWNNLPTDVANSKNIPTKTSDLTNDSNLAYKTDIPTDYATDSELSIVDNKITKTYIDNLGIQAATVNANWVYAGNLSANQINSGYLKSYNYNGSTALNGTEGSMIDMSNGRFNFGGGKLLFDGTTLSVTGHVDASTGSFGDELIVNDEGVRFGNWLIRGRRWFYDALNNFNSFIYAPRSNSSKSAFIATGYTEYDYLEGAADDPLGSNFLDLRDYSTFAVYHDGRLHCNGEIKTKDGLYIEKYGVTYFSATESGISTSGTITAAGRVTFNGGLDIEDSDHIVLQTSSGGIAVSGLSATSYISSLGKISTTNDFYVLNSPSGTNNRGLWCEFSGTNYPIAVMNNSASINIGFDSYLTSPVYAPRTNIRTKIIDVGHNDCTSKLLTAGRLVRIGYNGTDRNLSSGETETGNTKYIYIDAGKSGGIITMTAASFVDNAGVGTASDLNAKKDIGLFSSQHEALFNNITPRTFKYIDGNSGRTHFGFIAQELRDAAINAGLTTQDIAAFMTINEVDGVEKHYIRYQELISLNTHMIQKCLGEINNLKMENEVLKQQLENIKQNTLN